MNFGRRPGASRHAIPAGRSGSRFQYRRKAGDPASQPVERSPRRGGVEVVLTDDQDRSPGLEHVVSGRVDGQTTLPFNITIEQGVDFRGFYLTGSAFSYHASIATSFPVPNSAGLTRWAGRGLSIRITDTKTGRDLTSGFVPFELLCTPGYGLNFQQPYPYRYFFLRNSKLKFDIRNRDNANRVYVSDSNDGSHHFDIAINGFKAATPKD